MFYWSSSPFSISLCLPQRYTMCTDITLMLQRLSAEIKVVVGSTGEMVGQYLPSVLDLLERLIDAISNKDILFNSDLSDQMRKWKPVWGLWPVFTDLLFFFSLFAIQLLFSSLLTILYILVFNFLLILNITQHFWTGGVKNKEGENSLTGATFEQKYLNSTQGKSIHVTWGDRAMRWPGICLHGKQKMALPAWVQTSWEGTETGSLDSWWC